jgi:nucleotide-binding universal stress UspA family protein
LITVCEPYKTQEAETCRDYLNDQAEKLQSDLKRTNGNVNARIITGSPESSILQYIKTEGISLIFLSSHGRTGIMPWAIGSTADKVLRRTAVPLIIVKAQESPEGTPLPGLYDRIIVTLDGSQRGAAVVPYAAEISLKLHSKVILIHVIDTERRVHNLGRVDTIPFIEGELESIKNRAAEYLDRESQKFSGARGVETVVKMGNVAMEIMKIAGETGASLIAMSSHGHSGLESWVIGSVTSKVLHAGGRSLLFVPALEAR